MIDLMWTGSWLWGNVRTDSIVEYEVGHFEDLAESQSVVRSPEWPHVYLGSRVFDLASLTKVIFTSTLLVQIAEELFHKKGKSFKDFLETPLFGQSTLGEVWNHCGGFAAHDFLGPKNDVRKLLSPEERLKSVFQVSTKNYDANRIGQTVYSDIGFWNLGLFIEKHYQLSIREIWQHFSQEKLGLAGDAFLDFGPFYLGQKIFEKTLNTEMRHARGQVNDDNAACWGGAAPHAGLFGNLDGIMGWVKWLFSEWDKKSFVAQNWLSNTDRHSESERFVCGWDRPSGDLLMSQAGYPAPQSCVGHLGFTGTSVWLDFVSRKFGVLLTNRVFVNANNAESLEQIRSLRRKFYSLLWSEESQSNKKRQWSEELKKVWLRRAEQISV